MDLHTNHPLPFPSTSQAARRVGGRIFTDPVSAPFVPPPSIPEEPPKPFEITLRRPSYIDPASVPVLSENEFAFWVYMGTVNGIPPSEPFLTHTAQKSTTDTPQVVYVQAESSMGQQPSLSVTGVTLMATEGDPLEETSEWNASLTRPATARPILGSIISRNGSQTIVQNTGNFILADNLSSISSSGGYVRELLMLRI